MIHEHKVIIDGVNPLDDNVAWAVAKELLQDEITQSETMENPDLVIWIRWAVPLNRVKNREYRFKKL